MLILKKYAIKLKENPLLVLVICIAIVLCIMKIASVDKEKENIENDEQKIVTNVNEEDVSIKEKVLVDVKGEVKKPGVYEISNEARVKDAIELAGGMKETGDSGSLNLAQKVHDEMYILVLPRQKKGEQENESDASIQNRININTASVEELQGITGVGPKKAESIIKYREENGSFHSLDDLDKVSGFGHKTIEKIKDEISW